MSQKSKDARRRRRQATVAPLSDLLAGYRAPSLMELIESAALSPTSAHRGLSLGRLFYDAVRLWPDGDIAASASDLPQLIVAIRARSPGFAALEDYVPLDPRREVRVDWNDASYRLLPGGLERPIAMFERARMVDRATREPLVGTLGFTVSDLAELVLTRLPSCVPDSRP